MALVRNHEPEWEHLNRADLEARQFNLLKRRLETIQATNTFYRDLWSRHGVDLAKINSLRDFNRMIPLVTKEDFMADQLEHPPFGRRLGVHTSELAELHLTSGTSGIGQAVCGLTATDVETGAKSYAALWKHAGLNPGDRGILTYPVSFLTAGLLGVAGARRFRLVPIYAFGTDKQFLFELMERMQPRMIFATPNLLRRLQAVAAEQGWDPRQSCRSLRAICMGLLYPPFSQVEEIMNFWGVPLFENYGTTEVGMAAAISCENGVWDGKRRYPMHFLERHILPEVIDPDTGLPVGPGEEGELVMTTLSREASPAIRFRTRDRVLHVPHTECSCGRPFDGIAPGETRRYDDMMKIKGVSVWPALFDDVIFAHAEVDEYRAEVFFTRDEREELLLRVAVKRSADSESTAPLLDKIREEVRRVTSITPKVEQAKTLEHFEFKAKRWTDLRPSGEQPDGW